MNGIIKSFEIKLDRKQTKAINEHLDSLTVPHFVIAQTCTRFLTFPARTGIMQVAIMTGECGREIQDVLNKYQIPDIKRVTTKDDNGPPADIQPVRTEGKAPCRP